MMEDRQNMKLIMENWRGYLLVEEEKKTWGDLAAQIVLTKAAGRWKKMGTSLLRFGYKVASSQVKGVIGGLAAIEDLMDFIPDEIQELLEKNVDEGTQALYKWAKENGGPVLGFIMDDVMGMDDSLTKNLAGFDKLNIEDEYEKLVNRDILKAFAKEMITLAKKKQGTAAASELVPDFNAEFEKRMQKDFGAHPDVDEPDIRPGRTLSETR